MAGVKGRSGRKQAVTGFRAWCREVGLSRTVKANIIRRARHDPEFALKLLEHGFGRPPQSLDVKVQRENTYRIAWPSSDGETVHTTALPDPGPN